MTQFLPPNLLALFAARDPIPFLPPVDKLPHEKQTTGYTGVAAFVKEFEDPKDTPPPVRIETREERREAKRKAKAEQVAYKLEQDIALWNPSSNPSSTTDPFKTLFVARINYDTSESKLRREFEMYGSIRKIHIVHERQTGKPRGYAFIEYEHVRDMHSAFKHADGRKIDGRRVLVDVEKGRSIKGWLPRRLGGGLGGTRRGGPDVNLKHSGREESRLEDRYIDRDRGDRERAPDRERARSRDRRRRSRSRSRDRHRSDRHKRDRSRDRERNRDRDASATSVKPEVDGDAGETKPDIETPSRKDRDRRRSRSRDRDRKRRRSRSRDRKRRDYDRRDRDSRRERNTEPAEEKPKEVTIKQEPNPDSFNNTGYEGEFNNNNNYSNNNSMEPTSYEAY